MKQEVPLAVAFPVTQQVGLYRIINFSSIYRLLMFCPVCREPWKDEVCYECGAFYEKQQFVVTDLSNYKVKHKRIYKRLDHFKEVLCQFQGKEGKHIPQEVIEGIRDSIDKDNGSITLLDIKAKQVRGEYILHPTRTGRYDTALHTARGRGQDGQVV